MMRFRDITSEQKENALEARIDKIYQEYLEIQKKLLNAPEGSLEKKNLLNRGDEIALEYYEYTSKEFGGIYGVNLDINISVYSDLVYSRILKERHRRYLAGEPIKQEYYGNELGINLLPGISEEWLPDAWFTNKGLEEMSEAEWERTL
jgi:hypothetical protein